MWDLPRPGLEPESPALAGGFLTTAPPGKSLSPFDTFTLSLKAQLQFFLGLAFKGRCQSFSAPSGSAFDSDQVSKLEYA